MIVHRNLTAYMGAANHHKILDYAERVDAGLAAGTLDTLLLSRCPECDDNFSNRDAAYADTHHIIVATTSDTFAVVVGCEGYFVVDPNLVGISMWMWLAPDAHYTIVTPDGVDVGTPGAPAIVIDRETVIEALSDVEPDGL